MIGAGRGIPGLVILALLARGPLPAHAQVAVPNLPASGFTPDLAVPDAPAFELLGTAPTTLLRPNTVHDVALMFSEFQDEGGSFRLPAALAFEVAPALLFAGPDLSKLEYEQKKALYAFRVSFAVLTDTATDGLSRMAAGLRYTVRNEADLRGDAGFLADQQVTPLTGQILEVYQGARDRMAEAGSPLTASIVLTPDEGRRVAEIQERIRERWEERYWNASGIDAALGVRASTVDATGADPRLTAYGLWASYAAPVAGWGQLVIGTRVGGERDRNESDFTQLLALGVRFNAGANDYKAFAALDNVFRESEVARLRGSLGFELRLHDWIWSVLSLGVRDEDGQAVTDATFKLNTAFPRT